MKNIRIQLLVAWEENWSSILKGLVNAEVKTEASYSGIDSLWSLFGGGVPELGFQSLQDAKVAPISPHDC